VRRAAVAVLALLVGAGARAAGEAQSVAASAPGPSATESPPGTLVGERPVGAPLTLDQYRTILASIAGALERDERGPARVAAEALRGTIVQAEGVTFEADPTLIEPVIGARDAGEAAHARLRIRRALASLGGREAAGGEADAALLERLAREEAARRPTPGGEVDPSLPSVRPPSVPEQIRAWLGRALDAIFDLVGRLLRWLLRFGPRKASEGQSGFTASAVAVLVAAIVVVLALFAFRSLRRRDSAAERAEPGEAVPGRDEDPLSREAGEWERYAGELAAAGRWREAIRAWYHAVLVTLFRGGRLHHQKGRTNWEYVSQVGPDAAWRPAFIDLTRTFDREWYGRSASAAEALREHARRAREVLRAVGGEAGP
jgi:hypothetical protein